ncbi:hypothetical protein [Pseudoduganella sp. R-43]|uniref:hypothetical protein n=1 Tax=unclassified Pseudoduganella TaxID=2637179 RepID=UPI003CF559D0
MKKVASLAGMILCMTASQVFLKFAALHSVVHVGALPGFIRNPWLWTAVTCSAGGICCWLLTLRQLPLAVAYPWTALIYVITPLVGAWCFAELLSASYAVGIVLILLGVLLTSRGVAQR